MYPKTVRYFEKRKCKGDVFLVGKNIKENEDIVIRMKNEGHLIGNIHLIIVS